MSKQETVFQLIYEYRSSGFTIKTFCEDRDIKAFTFNYWIKEKKKASSTSAFITTFKNYERMLNLFCLSPHGTAGFVDNYIAGLRNGFKELEWMAKNYRVAKSYRYL